MVKGHIKAKYSQATKNETTSTKLQEPTKTNTMEQEHVIQPIEKQTKRTSNQVQDAATETASEPSKI